MDEKLENILEHYQGKNFELIPILQEVQHEFGYLPESEMSLPVLEDRPPLAVVAITSNRRCACMGPNYPGKGCQR